MFTGITQALCTVEEVRDEVALRHITLDLGPLAEKLTTGASVAVNGTCLTVTEVNAEKVSFDVIKESLETTNLGDLRVGSRVNIERSFKFGEEVGGHVLSGHISGLVRVAQVEDCENERNICFRVPRRWMKYLLHKGFVALDGASLTIAKVDFEAATITVNLIPETIKRTTLGGVSEGDSVNLEVDSQTQAVVDTVERMMESPDWQKRVERGSSGADS